MEFIGVDERARGRFRVAWDREPGHTLEGAFGIDAAGRPSFVLIVETLATGEGRLSMVVRRELVHGLLRVVDPAVTPR